MQKGLNMTTLAVHLSEDLYKRLVALAAQTSCTKTYHVCKALEEYLDDVEDVYLVEAALAQYEAGNTHTTSHRELGKELGILDD